MRLSNTADEKKLFMKKATIIIDTREQKNEHITALLDKLGVMHTSQKLDYGDYSFSIDGKDFSRSCVIERKANVNEFYGNISSDRERIEKELETISRNANQCTLLLENCADWQTLKSYEVPEADMKNNERKVKNIGATCYVTLQSWRCGNRYNFTVEFVPDTSQTALKILELFFWYYHNYKKAIASRR